MLEHYVIILACVVTVLFVMLFVVEQQSVAIIERLGKFNRTSKAGLNFKIPLLESVKGRLSLRIQQLDVSIDTKTQDNVFVQVVVSVQYHILIEKIYEAFYKLTSPESQIRSFIFDVVRSQVPKMALDDVFENKDAIANAVKGELTLLMADFGYGIVKALVTDIDPDAKVKAAMNEINEQQRLRMAAQEKGEAEKILKIKQAEAEAASMKLNGEGIAAQRKAIIEGLKESVDEFRQSIPGTSAQDVMSLVLMTQYYETLKEIGTKNNSSTILLPHNPSGLKDIATQLREGIITGSLTADIASEFKHTS